MSGAARLAWVSWRYNHPPFQAWGFGMLHPDGPHPDLFVSPEEAAACNRALASCDAARLLDDKHAFERFCHGQDVAVPRTCAVYRNGQAEQPFDGGRPPARDLFVKPVTSSSGRHTSRWHYDGAWSFAGEPRLGVPPQTLDAEGLISHLEAASQELGGALLVQDAIAAHPVFNAETDTAPPMIRLSSARWPDERVEIMTAMLQTVASGLSVSQGNPLRLVDPADGRVLPVINGDDPLAATYQSDDPMLDGIVLPDWALAVDAVSRLHRALTDPIPVVAWDLIFSPSGPVVLEGNVNVGPTFEQAITKRPAADGRWHRVLAEYLT